MNWNRNRETEVRTAILHLLDQELQDQNISSTDATQLAEDIFRNLIQTTPPQEEHRTMQLIVMGRMGSGGGTSTKPGNITLNIGALMEAIANGAFTVSSAIQLPIAAPLATLLLWRSFIRTVQVSITETEAIIFYTMWANQINLEVHKSTLLVACNSLLTKYQKPHITQGQLSEALGTLQRIKAIGTSSKNAANWILLEKLRVPYK